MFKNILTALMIGTIGFGVLGCETSTGNSALAGGAGGALIGAGIGSLSHQRAGEGALLGGAIGAIGGAIVGNEIDKQDRQGGYARYEPGYDRPARYYERVDDYGYAPPPRYYRYSRTYYEPRTYYEVRSYRTYGGPRGGYYESYYRCD